MRVLIVEDYAPVRGAVLTALRDEGWSADAAGDGTEGLRLAKEGGYDVIILDVMLPGMDGFEVLKQLRRTSEVPVLMLTARGEEPDRIVGLEIGADDYLPKTFSTRELLARLRAVTRRATRVAAEGEPGGEKEIVVGHLRVNPAARVALLDDQALTLTPVEFDLLAALARARGRVKSREQLLEEIRDRNYDVFDRSIDVHISTLRRKLDDDAKEPRYIRTVRSAGYMLMNPGI